MLIDTHAHLDYPDFAADFEDVLARATEAGVTRILTIGTSLESSRRAVELAEKYPNVFAVIGVHPSYAEEARDDVITPLRELAKSRRVAAIGETGLDYHDLPSAAVAKERKTQVISRALQAETDDEIESGIHDGALKSKQASLFQQQLDLAVELRLNVVIHQRDAWADTLEIMRDYGRTVAGVFHCFGGTREQAEEVIALGHLVSFTGIVTFKNGASVREVAARLIVRRIHGRDRLSISRPDPFSRETLRTCAHAPRRRMHRRRPRRVARRIGPRDDPNGRGIFPAQRYMSWRFPAYIFAALALISLGASCTSVDRRHQVIISIPEQRMALLEDGAPLATYPVSTSKFGLGDIPGSSGTPLGALEVAQKIGGGAPSGAVFKDRRRTGEIVLPDAPGRDPIVTRILWLRGEEPQNARAYSRFIYIHGTPEERNIGLPVSYGCVRMRSRDVIELFEIVGTGARVRIENQPLESLVPGITPVSDRFVSTHNFAPSQIR